MLVTKSAFVYFQMMILLTSSFKVSRFFIITLLLLVLNLAKLYAAGDRAFPGVNRFYSHLGIGKTYNDLSYDNLLVFYSNKIKVILQEKKIADDKYDKNAIKSIKKDLKFLNYAHKLMQQSVSRADKKHAFFIAKRIYYSIISKLTAERKLSLLDMFGFLDKFKTTMPYVTTVDKYRKIGKTIRVKKRTSYYPKPTYKKSYTGAVYNSFAQAKKEAKNLVFPSSGTAETMATVSQLSQMSHDEVSRLDISTRHQVWHQEIYSSQQPQPWQDLENWANKTVTKILRKKNIQVAYDLKKVKRVLFLTKIKDTATSPKINTKDAYGQKWKVKWGNEVQVETMANRFYVAAGGKFSDLVYTNARGARGLTLILGDRYADGSCKKNINTFSLLSDCLLNSRYKFSIRPYVYAKGVITSFNIEKVLKYLPENAIKEYRAENLLGRSFVQFKESLSEFKPTKVMIRGGPVAASDLGADSDRVARSLLIFNMWIWNLDFKDLNNKAVLLKDFNGKKYEYIEFAHDMGSAMGFPGRSGEINHLSDKEYMHVGLDVIAWSPLQWGGHVFVLDFFVDLLNSIPFLNKSIYFNQFMMYRPSAWDNITYADGLWMARKIARIDRDQITNIVATTLWPEYVQQAVVNKMLMRRNRIAEIFDITEELDRVDIDPIDITRSFRTKDDRIFNAHFYDLELSSIENELKRHNLIDQDGVSTYVELVVSKNKIVSCKKSLLSNLLEAKWYPSGFTRRLNRLKDHSPLPKCTFSP